MKRLLDRLVSIFVFAAAITTLVLTYTSWLTAGPADALLGTKFLFTFAIILLALTIWQEFRYAHKARYAEALPLLQRSYQLCVDGARQNYISPKEVEQDLQRVCNHVAQAYSMITGTVCMISIRAIVRRYDSENQELFLAFKTICRDASSVHLSEGHANEVEFTLEGNTSLSWIFHKQLSPLQQVFFDNYLPWRNKYVSANFEIYGNPRDSNWPIIDRVVRWTSWKLPYKSGIVVPVQPPANYSTSRGIIGLFSISSGSVGVFSRRYDRKIIMDIGTLLNPLLEEWFSLVEGLSPQT